MKVLFYTRRATQQKARRAYQLSYLGDAPTVAESVDSFNLRTLYWTYMEGLTKYERETRPWGDFERFTLNEKTTVKIIAVRPGEAFSLQTHAHRDEFWRVLSGSGTITIGDTERAAASGDAFFSPRGSKHRVEGGPNGIALLEIAFGDFDENDITRLEDRYGRA